MKNQIQLILGDWSHDGHGKTETFIITSNLTRREILEAYDEGCDSLNCDLSSEISSEYEDHLLPASQVKKFLEKGFHFDELDFEKSGSIYLDTELYTELFLFTVKLGNPDFSHDYIELESINIGGYGLFS